MLTSALTLMSLPKAAFWQLALETRVGKKDAIKTGPMSVHGRLRGGAGGRLLIVKIRLAPV